MIALILGILVVTLAWAGVVWKGLPVTAAAVTTGVVVALLAVVYVLRRVKARKAAKALEGDLNAQAEAHAKTVRPDLQPEVQAMQSEFTRAIATLKSSKLSQGGRDALAILPWYLMIGPPGTGKSTALRNSGLKFPYLSNRGGAVRGVGGTRNCDWWLTNQAVFLDTAGRYSTGEEDRDEWLAFLDILGKHRPRRPINGLIVTVGVKELEEADPQAAGELGQRIRERLDEITSRLKVVVPIYILVTKCDLLPGFGEMFSDLPRSERGQIWGFTLPMTDQGEEAASERLVERFDELASVLEGWSMRRLGQERGSEAREHIYRFPQRFAALRKNLLEFAQPLFMDNVFQDTPVLRGLYFTSSTQEVAPSARTAPGGELFDGGRNGREPTEGRSYFLWDLFNKVMFQDQKLAVRSSIEELKSRRRTYAVAASCLAGALFTLVFPTLSFFENRRMVQALQGAISELKPDTKDEAVLFRNLTPLLDETEKLQQYNEHGAPLLSRFGLSRSGALYETAQKAYNKAARRIIIENQFDEIRDRLSSLTPGKRTAAWNPKSEDYARYYSDLKLYLLLTRPDPRDLEAMELQPKLQEREDLREFIVEQIVRRWDGLAGSGSTRISLITVKRHAQVFAKLLGDNPDQAAFERDPDLVLHARRALNGVRRSDIELANRLLRVQEQNQGQSLSLGQLMGGVPGISAARTIHPAFTRPLWEQQMRYFVDNQFKIVEQWVLTPDTTQDADALTAEIRTKYYQAYVNEWSSFLYSITVVPPQNEEETLRMLQGIINARPFDRLFTKVSEHVHLERKPKAVGVVEKVLSTKDAVHEESTSGESLSPRNVAGHFAGLLSYVTKKQESEDIQERNGVLELYYEQLRVVLAALEDESMKPQAKAEIVLKAKREVEAHLSGAGAWKPLLRQLLIPPLLLVGENITRDVAKKKDTAWCTNVVDRFKLMVEHRYPFCRNCEDASIAELGDMLKPGEGELWRFVKESLGEIVTLSEGQWTFTAEARAHYNPQMLVFLNKAQQLSDALFPNGPTESPKVRFKALFLDPDGDVSNLQRVVFSVDGESMKYDTGGGREQNFVWPGSYEKSGASIEAISLNGDKESRTNKAGTWGLFRMFEEHMRPERSENRRSFTTTWATDFGVTVRVRVTPDYTIKNPFFGASNTFLQVFRDPALKPPPGIALQGSGCVVANNNPSTVQ